MSLAPLRLAVALPFNSSAVLSGTPRIPTDIHYQLRNFETLPVVQSDRQFWHPRSVLRTPRDLVEAKRCDVMACTVQASGVLGLYGTK
ncbi:hypothetical protein BDP55DRAFT_684254 [Colletotrichum godetiae]|uniref:Uncharacterized protein n=1 Tax=Colletotrichum godetiae TaxID=1209918 RepID=A0AAJ0AA61_9PEZI|nr:uncharacterized protein BDP55DRAFT_684254 [Colletotrichum godetiae]KAK1657847.1 hypothetical protein BDP55DRAFT_684254 [Colletotrichum godetiae]